MPVINIPEKVCPHCGDTKWYNFNVKNKTSNSIVYRCAKRVLDTNRKSKRNPLNAKKALDKYRQTEKFKSVQSLYYSNNKEKIIKRSKDWKSKNKDRYNESIYKSKKSYSKNLTDYYIKNLLVKREPHLKADDISQDLIDMKRTQLLLMRQIV
jgi:hypothetical protein